MKKDTTSANKERTATELLKKKTTKAVNPNYKLSSSASGMTRQERMKVTRKGETELRAS